MRTLVFDTETTGLPKDRRASPTAIDQWPHIVQLSYILYDTTNRTIEAGADHLISLPTGVALPAASTKIHGITSSLLRRKGIALGDALESFIEAVDRADCLIAHNLEFDWKVIQSACHRVGIGDPFTDGSKQRYCTMMNGKALCGLWATRPNGSRYIKFPKLKDLHKALFQEEARNLHDAFADILVCLRCYMAMAHDEDLLQCTRAKQLYDLYRICPV